jgi:hypothetical protein
MYGANNVRVDDDRYKFPERFSPNTNPRGMNFRFHENRICTLTVETSTRKGDTILTALCSHYAKVHIIKWGGVVVKALRY